MSAFSKLGKRMDKGLFAQNQKIFQQLLRELREQAGLRQQDLADQLGEPQSFVSKYETGERRVDVLELREICRVIGLELSEFVQQLEQRLNPEIS